MDAIQSLPASTLKGMRLNNCSLARGLLHEKKRKGAGALHGKRTLRPGKQKVSLAPPARGRPSQAPLKLRPTRRKLAFFAMMKYGVSGFKKTGTWLQRAAFVYVALEPDGQLRDGGRRRSTASTASAASAATPSCVILVVTLAAFGCLRSHADGALDIAGRVFGICRKSRRVFGKTVSTGRLRRSGFAWFFAVWFFAGHFFWDRRSPHRHRDTPGGIIAAYI